MQADSPISGVPDSANIEPEVKFVTPNNDLFYAAGLYRPLRTEKQEIRLLSLLPGPPSVQIRAEIVENVSLADKTHNYHALSYCAGDATVIETIKVQGIDFNVFSNLGIALRKIRKVDESLLIWIDQICINQRNVTEREQQVMLMRDIYASASKTILWLGQEEAEGHTEGLAVSFAHTLCERARSAQVTGYGDAQHALGLLFQILREQNADLSIPDDTATHASNRSMVFNEKLIREQAAWLSGEIRNGNYSQELAALAIMYRMPWWTRCWVFQEAIVSKSADVLYGSSAIDFEAMRVANAIMTLVFRSLFASPDLQNIQQLLYLNEITRVNMLVELEEKWKTRSNLGIREILNVSRQLASTDPKDRVYAMLGLMDPAYNVKPDYKPTCTIAHTFIAAVKAAIEHDGVLDILADGHEVNRNQALGLPSWVPDFSCKPGHLPLCNWEHDDGKSKFDATLHTFLEATPLLKNVPPPQFLPDEKGRPDRVLRCVMLNLGPVALQHTIADREELRGIEDIMPRYLKLLETAGLKDVYPTTVPERRESFPDVPLHLALKQTLGFGNALGSGPAGDRDVGFGDAEVRGTNFRDQIGDIGIGNWRFFVTPSKIMGVAPAATEWDDTLCLLIGATVPFILRKIPMKDGEDNNYVLVGPAYLHGYMSGQGILEMLTGRRADTLSLINIH